MLDAPVALVADLAAPRPVAPHVSFIFATGVKNSAPTIEGGCVWRDQLAECGHYSCWHEDFPLVRGLGCGDLRARPHLHWPLLGFTWDQVDWDVALRKCRGRVNPRSLYDLARFPRAAGRAYARLIEGWGEVLMRKVRAFTSWLQG